MDIVKHNGILGVACSRLHLPRSLSLSPSRSCSLYVCTCVRAKRANPCELLAVANYEVRLITTYVENRKFSETRWWERTLEGGLSGLRRTSKHRRIIQSEWDCYYPDARLSMHIISPGFQRARLRGGFRLMRVLITFRAKQWCRLIIRIFQRRFKSQLARSNVRCTDMLFYFGLISRVPN